MTFVWEFFAPISIFWAILLPCHMAWILFDRPELSPIALGLLLILPFKFVPGMPLRLL